MGVILKISHPAWIIRSAHTSNVPANFRCGGCQESAWPNKRISCSETPAPWLCSSGARFKRSRLLVAPLGGLFSPCSPAAACSALQVFGYRCVCIRIFPLWLFATDFLAIQCAGHVPVCRFHRFLEGVTQKFGRVALWIIVVCLRAQEATFLVIHSPSCIPSSKMFPVLPKPWPN